MSATTPVHGAEPLLEAERLVARHPRVDFDALRDVTLRVEPGEILALVGPNGSGKSTLLSCLARELAPRRGRLSLSGLELRLVPRRRLALRLAHLPQQPECAEGMRVEDLVGLGRFAHHGPFASPSADDRAAIRDALHDLDLVDLRRRRLETLSGGERRRAFLAMTLAQRAPLVLLDEPTAALDVRQQWDLLDRLAELNRERGVTLVTSLHDLEQAASIAHRVAVLHRGRLYAVGKPERVIEPGMMRDVFGVDASIEKDDGRLRIHVLGPADPLRSL